MYLESQNMAALKELRDEVRRQDRAAARLVIKGLKTATFDLLATYTAKDPLVKKVHDAYYGYKKVPRPVVRHRRDRVSDHVQTV